MDDTLIMVMDMKKRTVEISVFETVTDEQFDNILLLLRIIEGVCGVEVIK